MITMLSDVTGELIGNDGWMMAGLRFCDCGRPIQYLKVKFMESKLNVVRC